MGDGCGERGYWVIRVACGEVGYVLPPSPRLFVDKLIIGLACG